MEDRFLTPSEAASYLGGLNTRTLTRWAREGYLPAFPVGEGKRRLWRFLESDLEKWMLARRTGRVPSEIQAREDTLFAATDAPTRRLLEG
jgi:excisionase family DNA binding protein